MINDAQVFLSGFVATEPTFKKVGNGVSSVRLRLAYNGRRQNRDTGEWSDLPTSFVTVQCWRALADNVALCLRKGEPVVVRGRLQVRRYENSEGSPRIAVEVDASSLGHDLTRGVSHFTRTRKAQGAAEPGLSLVPPVDHGDEIADFAGPHPAQVTAVDEGLIDGQAVADFAREIADARETSPELVGQH